MTITIHSTPHITVIDGCPCRVWEGTTAAGVSCYLLVHRIAVAKEEDSAQFELELQEAHPPQRLAPLRERPWHPREVGAQG